YTPLRRVSSGAGAVAPVQTAGIRVRIGGLRSQMWFIPNAEGAMGDPQSWNDPNALARPVPDGDQASPKGTAVTAIPYNPALHALPDANTREVDSSTPCATGETNCRRRNNGQYRRTIYGRNQVYAVSIRVK